MPLSLDDLRKTTSTGRRDKRRRIVPTLIETTPERELAADFCNYFASLVAHDKRQRDFSEQYLTERAGGDFKLARGLITALMGFYGWESETFEERLPPEQYVHLQSLGLGNPSALRLALYDYVSATPRAGFVSDGERGEAIELFAAGLGLEPALIEELLYLDGEENARLRLRKRRDGESFRSPTPDEVVRRYNRLAVEALLYNSSEIIFGFGSTLPGTLVKKIGYYSKELHIPYDLDYNSAGEIQLRLYGPVQAFGSPTRHGDRLARLTLITLSLAHRLPTAEPDQTEKFDAPRTTVTSTPTKTAPKKTTSTALTTPLRSAVAQVHLRDKIYAFDVAEIAGYLARPDEDLQELALETPVEEVAESEIRESGVSYTVKPFDQAAYYKQKETSRREFDSSVESRFWAEFAALAREGHTAGWQIEREPEALALPEHHLLFVPDFALQRGQTRVWLEIIGFWTADYRARKLEKLDKLKAHGSYNLLLAADVSLKADFQDGPPGQKRVSPYPILFYKNEVRATDVIAMLGREYDDRAGRLQQVAAVGQSLLTDELLQKGFLPEEQLYKLLKAYNKNELLTALQKVAPDGVYVDSYGLCAPVYLQAAGVALADAIALQERLSLEEANQVLLTVGLETDSSRIEALLAVVPGVVVARPSLFEVYVQSASAPLELPVLVATGKGRRGRR